MQKLVVMWREYMVVMGEIAVVCFRCCGGESVRQSVMKTGSVSAILMNENKYGVI